MKLPSEEFVAIYQPLLTAYQCDAVCKPYDMAWAVRFYALESLTALNPTSPIQQCITTDCLCIPSLQAALQNCINCALSGNPSDLDIASAYVFADSKINPFYHHYSHSY